MAGVAFPKETEARGSAESQPERLDEGQKVLGGHAGTSHPTATYTISPLEHSVTLIGEG